MISFENKPLYLDDISLLHLGRSGIGVVVEEHMHGGVYELLLSHVAVAQCTRAMFPRK